MPVARPRLKILRRLGTSLPGLTLKDHEKRAYPPGQHGPSGKRRRVSDYRRRLEEKQKVRFHYGITERQLRRYYATAATKAGRTGDVLLALLERRLDNVVFRLGFARTIRAARQLVAHRHVLVNGKRVDRSSYPVKIGESISVAEKSRKHPQIELSTEHGPVVKLPSFLALDPEDKLAGRMISAPMRHDVPFVVQENAIVEHYAR